MSSISDLILEANRAGVLLEVDGETLRYKAIKTLPKELADHLRAHRSELIAALKASEAGSHLDDPSVPTSGTQAMPAVSENLPLPIYTRDEQNQLEAAGIAQGDLPLLDTVKAVFPSAQVIAVRTEQPPEDRVNQLLGEARAHAPAAWSDLRDVWEERMAICMHEGGLSEAAAQRVALAELQQRMAEVVPSARGTPEQNLDLRSCTEHDPVSDALSQDQPGPADRRQVVPPSRRG